MGLKIILAKILKPAVTKAEAVQSYRNIALAEAVVALAMLLVWASVPAWVEDNFVPKFSLLCMSAAALFAFLAIGTLAATTLIKRDLY